VCEGCVIFDLLCEHKQKEEIYAVVDRYSKTYKGGNGCDTEFSG
jgi:hypothetical protein